MIKCLKSSLILGFGLLLPWMSAYAASPPAWLLSTSEIYPSATFMTGIGQGDSLQAADDQALYALAKSLEVKVRSLSSSSSEIISKDQETSSQTQYEQYIESQSDKKLEGAQIEKRWFDKKQKIYYSLAILPRQVVMGLTQEKITQVDQQIIALVNHLQGSQDKKNLMERYALRTTLQNLFQARQAHVLSFLVVCACKLSDVPVENYQSQSAEIKRYLDESGAWDNRLFYRAMLKLRKALSHGIQVHSSPDFVNTKGVLSSVLRDQGLMVTQDSPQFWLEASVEVGEPVFKKGWYFMTVQMKLIWRHEKEIVLSDVLNWQVSATTEESLNQRINEKMKQAFANWWLEMGRKNITQ